MSCLGYTYNKNSSVYLKFIFNWTSCILSGSPTPQLCDLGQLSSLPLSSLYLENVELESRVNDF